MTTLREAAQQALEALQALKERGVWGDFHGFTDALRAALAEPVQEPQCNPHPKAPHGFLRNASHNEHRYVCECEGWEPYEAGYQAGMEAALAEPVPDHATISEWQADNQRKPRHVSYVCPQCHWSLDERKPLTGEEIQELSRQHKFDSRMEKFVRIIEIAHGIKDD